MARVSISLLGDCRIAPSASDPAPSLGQKEQGLLAVLALASGTPVPRERLAALLWSDRDERHARDSLKHALGHLREALGSVPDALCSDRQSVRLDPGAVEVDAAAFERHCAEGTEAAAERALALYRGGLLEGCAVRDPAFEDWLATERRRFARLAEQAAGRIMAGALEAGDADRALDAASRLEAMDPLREDACRTIMTCLARKGDRCGALRRFETLRTTLRDQLGVAPEPQTLAVLDDVSKDPLRQADPATPPHTPARPSIAVLAFDVAGTDPEQAYFADGVVEEIIGALSRVRWLFVISRSSSFAWRGEQEDVTRIGQTLGVRYILSGSVRRGGDRLRIAGRLVDAASGGLLWAETFEGGLENVFDLQDRVTARVVGAVAPRLEQAEIERARAKLTGHLDAYDVYLRGLAALHRWTREGNLEAIRAFRTATAKDASFASAYGLEARCYSQQKACGWVSDLPALIAATRQAAGRAIDHGRDDAVALATAGIGMAFVANEVSHGDDLVTRALELNPNLANAWLFSGWINGWLGRAETALDHVARGMRLNPYDPETAMMYAAKGYAHFVAGDYADAARWAERSARNRPSYLIASCILAASRAFLGDMEEARRMVARIREIDRRMTASDLIALYPIQREIDRERWREGMRMAGLPK